MAANLMLVVLVASFGAAAVSFDRWSKYWEHEARLFEVDEENTSGGFERELRDLYHGQAHRASLCGALTATACRVSTLEATVATCAAGLLQVPNHIGYLILLGAIASCVGLGGALVIGRGLYSIWICRRVDAFDIFFYTRGMSWLYNRNRTAKLFYGLNPLPIWSLFDSGWFDRIERPSIDDVFACASLSKFPNVEPLAGQQIELLGPRNTS